MHPFRSISIQRRLIVSLTGVMSVAFGVAIFKSECLIRQDQLQRHQHIVLEATESIERHLGGHDDPIALDSLEAENHLREILRDYSSSHLIVWLSRPNQEPIFPNGIASRYFLDQKGLLQLAGLNASAMQKPRSFAFAGQNYMTSSMLLPLHRGVLRFLEDVGMTPTSRFEQLATFLLVWLGLLLASTAVVIPLVRQAFKPLQRFEQALDQLELGEGCIALTVKDISENQPHELKGLVLAYGRLVTRLREAREQHRLMTSAMSHELLTPVSLVVGLANRLVRQSSQLNTSVAETARSILVESQRINRLVRDLLELSRASSSQTMPQSAGVPFQPARLVLELIDDLRPLPWQQQLVIAEDVKELANQEELVVRADPDRYRQCIMNILENAIKYSPSMAAVFVSCQKTQKSFDVLIKDSGPGIAESEREHIFEPYFRSDQMKTQTVGTGIGLAVVKLLIERMGGTIQLCNPGEPGACFRLSLPIDDGSAERLVQASRPSNSS